MIERLSELLPPTSAQFPDYGVSADDPFSIAYAQWRERTEHLPAPTIAKLQSEKATRQAVGIVLATCHEARANMPTSEQVTEVLLTPIAGIKSEHKALRWGAYGWWGAAVAISATYDGIRKVVKQ